MANDAGRAGKSTNEKRKSCLWSQLISREIANAVSLSCRFPPLRFLPSPLFAGVCGRSLSLRPRAYLCADVRASVCARVFPSTKERLRLWKREYGYVRIYG